VKVGVIGGAGFLGSHVADELSRRGQEVIIFDRLSSPYLQETQREFIGDILNKSDVMEFVAMCDVIYNFAGLADLNVSVQEPEKTLSLNIMGNLNVLEACKAHGGIKRFIYASSAYVFSSKGSFYGISKRCSEQLVEEYGCEHGLPYTIIRYGSVYGPRADQQNRVYRIIKQALTEKKIEFQGSGDEEREYIHVRDAAALSVNLLESEEFLNEHVVLTGVERFNYLSLLKMIKEMLNDEVELNMFNKEYKGHYNLTPYTFIPKPGKKLVSHSFIDLGQGLLEVMNDIYLSESINDNQE